jgi:hypothetical protein
VTSTLEGWFASEQLIMGDDATGVARKERAEGGAFRGKVIELRAV